MTYIQVILPLRLQWEPWYSCSEEVAVGDRVRVRLAGKEYVAVVSSVGGSPDISSAKIQEVIAVEKNLERVSGDELGFWRFIADYYLCTLGEVYKYVYPQSRMATEERKSNRSTPDVKQTPKEKRLKPTDKQDVKAILDALVDRKPVLYTGEAREAVYAELVRRTIADGRDVLVLRPDAAKPSYVRQRELSRAVRGASPMLVEGHRSNIFLPWCKLGLVIVDEEQSPSYKQDSPAPRYNARDAAIALAARHGADVVLGSAAPSLESLYNSLSKRYSRVEGCATGDEAAGLTSMIDVTAERRKNGMRGSLSIKLLDALAEAKAAESKVLILFPWASYTDIEIELREAFRDNRFRYGMVSKASAEQLAKSSLTVVMCADALLDKGDFRADEHAFNVLRYIQSRCGGELIIHGRDLSRPVFEAIAQGRKDISNELLSERKTFGYPPFSRMVQIRITDANEARHAKMEHLLSQRLGGLQILLPKDRKLASSKKAIADKVAAFEAEYRYTGHISIDVDP